MTGLIKTRKTNFHFQSQTKFIFCVQYSISGADDVIAFNCDDNIYELEERDLFLNELKIREPYDVIFLTTSSTYNREFIYKFLTENGCVIDTDEKPLASDEYGFFMRFLCSVSIHQVSQQTPTGATDCILNSIFYRFTDLR